MKNLTLSFTIIIKGCMTKNMTPEQIAEQLNEHVQHEVKNLNIPAVIKSVCENCSNVDFNETMGCKNYLQGFKCENFEQTGL